jgi:hypothetical protein
VPLTAESPRLLLLSLLHRAGDVEKHALGALRVHWADGNKNDSIASDLDDARSGRISREVGMEAIAGLCCGCRGRSPPKVQRGNLMGPERALAPTTYVL